jgi:subtilase family serine protease
MKTECVRVFAIVALCLIVGLSDLSAQTVQLTGTISPEALKLPNYGDLPSTQTLSLQIWFKPHHQDQLTNLLANQQDSKSPRYRKWLTPQEYAKRFGVTQQEFNKVSNWLKKEGFQITSGSPANGFIKFRGNVLSIGHAFDARILKFSADGSKYGNFSDPQVPAEYGDVVGSVTGLDNLHASKAMVEPSPDITLSDFTAVGPADFYAFYDETPLQNAGVTGTSCIAIVGVSDFNPGPIQAFNNQFGLPDNSVAITKVLADGSNPGVNGAEMETLLDLEWSHAVAPGAATKYFLGDENNATNTAVVDALNAAVTDGSCAVISVSFGLCGLGSSFYTSTVANIVNQAQSQGQAIMMSAGDQGAAGLVFSVNQCVTATTANVNELASNPLITSVGGTSLNAPFNAAGVITGYTSERVWDDPNDSIPGGGATGGGASVFFSKPSFQSGVTPADGARDQPDVALLASPNFPGVFVFEDNGGAGALGVVGGTSLSAPAWAGIVDLLVQQSGGKVGSINPKVYALASAGQGAAGFHDIITGNNNFNGVTGFSAGPGYDQATGWGSVDVNQFVTAMAAPPTGTPTPTPAPTPTPTPTPVPTPTPTPKVSASVGLSQGALNFGKVKVGKSKTKVMTLTNTAKKKGGATITFNGASIAGSSEFGGSTNCTSFVGPKGKCKVMVFFAPASAGGASATITVNSNASNGPTSFSVTGTGQ